MLRQPKVTSAKTGVDSLLLLVVVGMRRGDGVGEVVEIRDSQAADSLTIDILIVAFHDVRTEVGGQVKFLTEGMVIHKQELMVDLILRAGNLHVFRLLLRVDGIALIVLVGVVVEVCLVLSLEVGDDLIAHTHIAIDTVTKVVLIVLVAAPVRVVMELDRRVIDTTHVP